MPVVPPNLVYGKVGTWRAWSAVKVRQSGAWVNADYVYAFLSGAWTLVWAYVPSAPQSPAAAIQGDESVDITWTADDPEAVTSYQVRRADGTLVETVTANGGPYTSTDSAPRAGSQTWTVTPYLGAVAGTPVATSPITVAAAPANVVAATSNVGTDTNVDLTWDASDGAATYKVYRPDGTLVTTTASLSAQDTDPRPVTGGTYLVTAITLGGYTGSTGIANALTLGAPAPTPTVDSITGDDVALSWTNTGNDYDKVQVLRDGAALSSALAHGTTTYTDTDASEGVIHTYAIRYLVSGNAGTAGTGVNASIAPNVPPSVSCTPTATVGELRFSWGTPAGTYTSFEAEYSDDGISYGGTETVTSPWYHTFTGGSGARYIRVRTVAPGGNSAWVVCSNTPVWDTDPPAVPTITSYEPEASYGRMVLRFTTSAADNYSYDVEFDPDSGFTTVVSAALVGNSQAVSVVCGTVSNAIHATQARVRTRDQWGNTGAWVTATYTTAVSPTVVDAIEGRTWRNGAWRTVSELIQMGGTSSGENTGCWFYDEDLRDAALGRTIIVATMEYYREDGSGPCSTLAPLFWTHNLATFSADPNIQSQGASEASRQGTQVRMPPPTCSGNSGGTFTMPSEFRAALKAGSIRGIAANHEDCAEWSGGVTYCYQQFGDAGTTGGSPSKVSGRITLQHLG